MWGTAIQLLLAIAAKIFPQWLSPQKSTREKELEDELENVKKDEEILATPLSSDAADAELRLHAAKRDS